MVDLAGPIFPDVSNEARQPRGPGGDREFQQAAMGFS